MSSCIVLSIRIRNFRGFGEATFSFLEDGITGLEGENGSGKSTVQDALMWCLFGEYPEGAVKNDLRRTKSDHKDDECSVSVIIKHQNQIIEVLRELRGRNNTVHMNIFVDGVETTHTTPTTGTPWVINRLGIDAKGFFAAYIIRQKELDNLITSPAPERRKLVEKFFGIEKASEALKISREEASIARKVYASLPGSEEEVEYSQQRTSRSLEEYEQELSGMEYLSHSLEIALEQKEKQENKYQVSLDLSQNILRLSQLLKNAENNVELTKEKITSIEKLLSSAQKRSAGGDEKSFNKLVAQRNKLSQSKASIETRIIDSRKKISELENNLFHAKNNVAEKENLIVSLDRQVEEILKNPAFQLPVEDIDEVKKQALDIEKSISTNSFQIDELRARSVRLSKSINALSETHDSAQCPTCHSHLDDPSELIQELKQEKSDVDIQGVSLGSDIKTNQEILSQLKSKEKQIKQQEDLRVSLVERKKRIEESATQEITSLEAINVLVTQLENDVLLAQKSSKIGKDQSELEEVEKSLTELNVKISRQSESQEAAQEAARYQEQLEILHKERDEQEYKSSEFEIEISSLSSPSEGDLADQKKQLAECQSRVDSRREDLFIASKSISALEARYNSEKETLKRNQETLEKKKEALFDLEMKVAISDVLDKFRKDRVSRIAPEMSDLASSIVESVTDGVYTGVTLNEDFTPVLLDSYGDEVAISKLSGGEKSVVSLALRLAMGDMKSGGNSGGLLWADEILVSQDDKRRTAILHAIRSLDRQIILTSHTTNSDDIYDKAIRVVRNEESGAYIDA